MEQKPLPSDVSREAEALIEVGHTAVAPGVARALLAFFILSITVIPVVEVSRTIRGASSAWSHLSGLPFRAHAAYTGDPIGTPGLWNRTLAANRAALADLAAFEDALEDESAIGRTLRPPAQRVLSGWLGAGNERVYVGTDGWLFYRPDVEHVSGAAFTDPAQLARRVAATSEWRTAPQPDPQTAILHVHRQLAERGIVLVVVPIPVKPSIHPEKLASRQPGPARAVHNPAYAPFIDGLRRSGVEVFDPAPLLANAARSGAQYLATDTHWRPESMELVAGHLAAFVRERVPLGEVPSAGWRVEDVQVTATGDSAAMLDLPEGQTLYPPETVWTRRITTPDGATWRASTEADVLLLGDSFTNIYSLESMGWGTSAGFAEQLSYALGRPLSRIVQNDEGAYATRALLAASPERLRQTRVVIWQFAARELSFGDWRIIDFPR